MEININIPIEVRVPNDRQVNISVSIGQPRIVHYIYCRFCGCAMEDPGYPCEICINCHEHFRQERSRAEQRRREEEEEIRQLFQEREERIARQRRQERIAEMQAHQLRLRREARKERMERLKEPTNWLKDGF